MKRERPQYWEVILQNTIVYLKCTHDEIDSIVFPETPKRARVITPKEILATVERKGLQIRL